MSDDGSQFLADYRAMVEKRVREQIARHQQINPNIDPRSAVEIQMKQEREYLERLIEAEDTTPAQAELLHSLVQWLPQLQRKLTG